MLRTIFVIAILVPGLFLAFKSRFSALLLYLWFAFFRPQDWMWVDVSSLHLSLVLGLVLVVPAIFSGIWPDMTHILSVGSLLFLTFGAIAHLNAVNATVSLYWLDFLTCLILVSLLATRLITTPRRLLAALAVVAGSLGFHATKAGLASVLSGGVHFSDGLAGAFIDNNGYALATVMVMPLLLAIGQNTDLLLEGYGSHVRRLTRWGLFLSIPLCAMTVVSTFSRGGFVALAGAALAYTTLHERRVRFALALSLLLPVAVILAPVPKGYVERLDTIQTYDQSGTEDRSALGRIHFWQVAIRMVEAHPLGVGLRNFDYAYDEYDFSNGAFGNRRAVHNSHFQVLAELGYPGAAIWTAQFILAFWFAFRVRSRSRAPVLSPASARFLLTVSNGIICSMVGFLIGGSFIALALNDLTWITFGILAALDRISRQMCKAAQQRVAAAAEVTSRSFDVRVSAAAAGSTFFGAHHVAPSTARL